MAGCCAIAPCTFLVRYSEILTGSNSRSARFRKTLLSLALTDSFGEYRWILLYHKGTNYSTVRYRAPRQSTYLSVNPNTALRCSLTFNSNKQAMEDSKNSTKGASWSGNLLKIPSSSSVSEISISDPLELLSFDSESESEADSFGDRASSDKGGLVGFFGFLLLVCWRH